MSTKPVTIRLPHRVAAEKFLEATTGPFRRSALADKLYPLTAPRSSEKAAALADKLLQAFKNENRIRRHGHQHWIVTMQQERTLKSGRQVAELDAVVSLTLTTRCPAKYITVDMETGEVWSWLANGRPNRAQDDVRQEAAKILAD